jgi:alanine racemase
VHRSELTVDLGALRRNVKTLLRALDGAELWAVVKADGYGHGAVDAAGAALGSGASALCVATIPEGLALRTEFPDARILVMGPAASNREIAHAREAGLELAISGEEIPDGIRVHLKLDTGMGRYGLAELPAPPVEVVGLMTHLATADSDAEFARAQIERFRAATNAFSHLTRHVANSAAALRLPEARFDAARCGIALYGLSPFGGEAVDDGLEPVLSWTSQISLCKLLRVGESTGYGRRWIAQRETWIGIVPVGYADGFRRELPVGTPVVLLGHGVTAEGHARVAGTINYEVVTGIRSDPRRARRTVIDG